MGEVNGAPTPPTDRLTAVALAGALDEATLTLVVEAVEHAHGKAVKAARRYSAPAAEAEATRLARATQLLSLARFAAGHMTRTDIAGRLPLDAALAADHLTTHPERTPVTT